VHTPASPLPLSIALTCKNSQAVLPRLLTSVASLASEIIAVDSGSTDGTISLLEQHAARVIHSPWLGYVKTKQIAIDACTQPWVLLLDSDESIEPDLAASLRRALATPTPTTPPGYMLNRVVFYQNTPLRYAWQPEWRLRLFQRGLGHQAGVDPHDYIELRPHGQAPLRTAPKLTGILRHDSFATFAEQLEKQNRYARIMATQLAQQGKTSSASRLVISTAGAFFKQLVLRRAFLDGTPGVLAAAASAHQALAKHAMLLELTKASKHTP
jgi:glycosyltransferase involved in cell wall biosynthesis